MASTFDPKGRNFMENAMDKVMEYLKQAKGAWYLATVEDGQPRVRPFGAQVVYNGRLYIQTSNKKKVYAQLKAEPRFEICAFIDGGKWMRLSGKAVEDTSRDAKVAMLDANPGLKRMYSADDDKTAVFYIEEGTADFCSFTTPAETVKL